MADDPLILESGPAYALCDDGQMHHVTRWCACGAPIVDEQERCQWCRDGVPPIRGTVTVEER